VCAVAGALLGVGLLWVSAGAAKKSDRRAWDEFFSNEEDVLFLDCERFTLSGVTKENVEIQTRYLKLSFDGKEHDLEKTESFSGVLRKMSFKRDAMGFGDVKFIACIGAFLGWEAVLFTVMAGSCFGALVGGVPLLMGRLLGRKDWSVRLPFGPYLSMGALLWMFAGREIVTWYLSISATLGTPADPGIPFEVQ
jgi:leader peptidase (prepilin peptidase)/N-methyltransferase